MSEKAALIIMLMDPDTAESIEVCKLGDRYPDGSDSDGEEDVAFGYYVREPGAWDSLEVGLEVRRVAQRYLARK